MGDFIVHILEWAFEFWNFILGMITGILSTSPDLLFGGTAWTIIETINEAFQAAAYGLLAIFFLMSLLKGSIVLTELRRPETIVRYFLQLFIAMGVITHGMDIVKGLFAFGTGLVTTVSSADLADGPTTLPADIVDAIENTNPFSQLGLILLSLLGALIIIVISITILLQVYGRFFKIYMFAALAPIALSGFAGSETSFMGKNFIKSFAAVCLEGAIIMLACVLWKAIAMSAIGALPNPGNDPTTMTLQYLVSVVFSMILLAGIIKTASSIPKAALGI
jgi:hypothetical protein